LEYKLKTKKIAYADNLMILTKGNTQAEIENYTSELKEKGVQMW
jgi:hypothetical protein